MIYLYNHEVLNNWNNRESNKSSQDIFNDYMDETDALYRASIGQDSQLQDGMIYTQVDAIRIKADKNTAPYNIYLK